MTEHDAGRILDDDEFPVPPAEPPEPESERDSGPPPAAPCYEAYSQDDPVVDD